MLTLYSQQVSGNAYKPRLIMALLGIPFRIVDMNTYDGHAKADYLAKNPSGVRADESRAAASSRNRTQLIPRGGERYCGRQVARQGL